MPTIGCVQAISKHNLGDIISMYVCMYVCIYLYLYLYIYICKCVYTHTIHILSPWDVHLPCCFHSEDQPSISKAWSNGSTKPTWGRGRRLSSLKRYISYIYIYLYHIYSIDTHIWHIPIYIYIYIYIIYIHIPFHAVIGRSICLSYTYNIYIHTHPSSGYMSAILVRMDIRADTTVTADLVILGWTTQPNVDIDITIIIITTTITTRIC